MYRVREGGSAREKCVRERGSVSESEGGCVCARERGREGVRITDSATECRAVQQRDSSYDQMAWADQMAWTGHKVQSTDVNNLKEEVRVMICAASLILPLSL